MLDYFLTCDKYNKQYVHQSVEIFWPKIMGIVYEFTELSKIVEKQKIQVIRRNQVYFSSSNVSTDTTVIVKD